VSVYGRYTVEISDDPRYERGKTYDLVLTTGVTPDPSSVVSATVNDAAVAPTLDASTTVV
jgi:hypothetical protein